MKGVARLFTPGVLDPAYHHRHCGATAEYTTTNDADLLTLRMRSDVCQGNPVATVTIDSLPARTIDVGATAYTDYTLPLTTANGGAGGTHTLKVEFLNNLKTADGSCDRNLYLDKVTVRQTAP